MATAKIQDDHIQCLVCLNYMLDRNPRSLVCSHAFCEECLNELVDNKKIKCPTCKELTEIGNDVQELERAQPQDRTQDNTLPKSLCQVCLERPPVYICNHCSSKLMCKDCKKRHNDVYKGHVVSDLCLKHNERVTHLCTKCVVPLCIRCGLRDHNEHQAYFVDYKKGAEELTEEVKSIHYNIKEEMKHVEAHMDETKLNHEISLDLDKRLSLRREYQKEQSKEIHKLSGTLKKKTEEYNRLQIACTEVRDQCNIRAASLKALTPENPGFCTRYNQLRPKAQRVLQDVQRQLQIQYSPPGFLLTDYIHEPVAVERPPEGNLRMQKLKLDIPTTDEINCKLQIALIGDDVVLVNEADPQHLTRLNKGETVGQYYPNMIGEGVHGVSVYDNMIYIVHEKTITAVSQKHGENALFYSPDVPSISKILVIDKDTIYISDGGNPRGKVYKYNTMKNQTEVVLEELRGPTYMSLMFTIQGPRYILTECNAHKISSIFDRNWRLLTTFGRRGSGQGEFRDPQATAVTECGLLVADKDNQRICHYSIEGQFLGDVITRQDGLDYSPYRIAYRYPNLWLCGQGNPLKCFQVKYQ